MFQELNDLSCLTTSGSEDGPGLVRDTTQFSPRNSRVDFVEDPWCRRGDLHSLRLEVVHLAQSVTTLHKET